MTWILVAHRARASLYEHRPGSGVRCLQELAGVQPTDDAPDLEEVAAEKLALVRFTLGLADVLETGVRESQVDGLILMAEARLLGPIRRDLSADTARRIYASLNLAKPDWNEDTLARQLEPLLPVERTVEASAELF